MLTTKEALNRWVDDIYPTKEEFLAAAKKRKFKIYLGIDPTGSDLHLGHSTNLLLLKHFQKLGHKIVLLIGDFTAMIGDPSGKETSRKRLTPKEVLQNARTFKDQAAKILSFSGYNPAKIEYNSKWWGKMSLAEGLSIGYRFTLQQLIERDMFQKRLQRNEPISFPEAFYPILQGYDSVALNVDAEVGGTDQTFNMLAGRELMKKLKNKEKFVITTKLLENPKTGKKLMSKTEGNYVSLNMSPGDMFGAIMALPDEVVVQVFELCTELPPEEFRDLEPLAAKKRLAREIVKLYHDEKEAEKATEDFEERHGAKPLPTFTVSAEDYIQRTRDRFGSIYASSPTVGTAVTVSGFVGSASEANRLIEQGAVKEDGHKLIDPQASMNAISKDRTLEIGKRGYFKIGAKKRK